jgi:[CysO sulfur-carrier protein]-S-L-cysteine hydrolase
VSTGTPAGLRFDVETFEAMLAHAIDGLPDEACGLLVGRPGCVERFVPCVNTAASAKLYEIDPYPSPTDVAQAPDPNWQFVIVSLKRDAPETRTYRIVDGAIAEEAITIGPRYHC